MARKLTATHRDIILAYFDTNMNVSKTARLLSYHPNSIFHALERIKFVTGKDPKVIRDLLVLVEIAKCLPVAAAPKIANELVCVECGVAYKGKAGLYCPACRAERWRSAALERKLSEIGNSAYSAKAKKRRMENG
jgi:hypothetical protein